MAETSTARAIRAPRGTALNAKSWLTEAPLRMLMNNLDPEVAERPEDLVVYGGIGKAETNLPDNMQKNNHIIHSFCSPRVNAH